MIPRLKKVAKNEWISLQCKSIDIYLKMGIHSKREFNTLKSITNFKPLKFKITIIEGNNGILLANNNSRIEIWTG